MTEESLAILGVNDSRRIAGFFLERVVELLDCSSPNLEDFRVRDPFIWLRFKDLPDVSVDFLDAKLINHPPQRESYFVVGSDMAANT